MKLSVEQILNLQEMKVLNSDEIEGLGLVIEVQRDSECARCPRCEVLSYSKHQNHWRMVKDLPWGKNEVLLRINRRQFRCKKCGQVFSEELEFIGQQRGYTKRLAKKIVSEVIESNVNSVARRNDMTSEEIATMLSDEISNILETDLSQVKRIGIDEISLVKGKGKYVGVIVDLDTNRPIKLVESRNQLEMREALLELGYNILNQIVEVSIDLWKPYKSLVLQLMPNVDVTADRFHVMKQVNEELDAARKSEKNAAKQLTDEENKNEILAGINKSKYALLKNEDNLTIKQKEKLEMVQKVSPNLEKMHLLKEEFRDIFDHAESWGDGVIKLLDWMYDAVAYFPKSIGTISRWFGEVAGYFDQKTSNGAVEGINNKLKLIKRLGYGFRNFENFRVRALLPWYFNPISP